VFLVGLTGGIGSGKSTVAGLLRSRGVPVVDVDALARDCVEPGPVLDAVLAHFGDAVRAPDGRLDRSALAAIVFERPEARRELEALTHPCIRERIDASIAQLLDSPQPPELVVLDHPLLVESGAHVRVGSVIVVEAPEDVRVRRLVRDRGMRRRDVRARIASQAGDAERRHVAHHIILNDLDLAALEASVELLLEELQAEARAAGEDAVEAPDADRWPGLFG
jgi:dephospho-CoA kinase